LVCNQHPKGLYKLKDKEKYIDFMILSVFSTLRGGIAGNPQPDGFSARNEGG